MNSLSIWNGINLEWAYSDLLRHILFKVACPHRAKDVLHDALLRYALTAERDYINQPHAYLHRIVSTVMIDHHREQAHYVPILANCDFYQLDNFAPSAEYLADLQQRLFALQTIVNALPKKCREVFWLYRIEGRSQREIAQQLGVSLKTVEAHMARAMLDLNTLCEQWLTH